MYVLGAYRHIRVTGIYRFIIRKLKRRITNRAAFSAFRVQMHQPESLYARISFWRIRQPVSLPLPVLPPCSRINRLFRCIINEKLSAQVAPALFLLPLSVYSSDTSPGGSTAFAAISLMLTPSMLRVTHAYIREIQLPSSSIL